MTWVQPSALFAEIETERETETDRARLRRLAAIRSRARTSQPPMVAVVASVAPEWTTKLPQRRRILDPQERRAICRGLAAERPLLQVLAEVHVSRTVYYRHLREDDDFAAQVDRALGRDVDEQVWTQLELAAHTFGRREYVTASGMVRESGCCSCGWECPPTRRTRAGAIAAWKLHVEAAS